MTIKDRVKNLANLRDISIPDLEKKCGFGNGTIGKWDGSVPNALKLSLVANELDTTMEYLLTGKYDSRVLEKAIFNPYERKQHEEETKEKLAAILGKSVDEVFGKKEKPAVSSELEDLSKEELKALFMQLIQDQNKDYLLELASQILSIASKKES